MSSSVPPTDWAKLLSLERGADRGGRLWLAAGAGVIAAGRDGADRLGADAVGIWGVGSCG
jgi:hypothetical protein